MQINQSLPDFPLCNRTAWNLFNFYRVWFLLELIKNNLGVNNNTCFLLIYFLSVNNLELNLLVIMRGLVNPIKLRREFWITENLNNLVLLLWLFGMFWIWKSWMARKVGGKWSWWRGQQAYPTLDAPKFLRNIFSSLPSSSIFFFLISLDN